MTLELSLEEWYAMSQRALADANVNFTVGEDLSLMLSDDRDFRDTLVLTFPTQQDKIYFILKYKELL